MANLFKSYEVANHFKELGIPKDTMKNWSKEKDTWRARLYKKLEQDMLKDLAKTAKENQIV